MGRMLCTGAAFALVLLEFATAAEERIVTGQQIEGRVYAVLSRSTLSPFPEGYEPATEDVVDAVTCTLARDEYEPLLIGVHTIGRPLKSVSVAVQTDLAVRVYHCSGSFLEPTDHVGGIAQGRTAAFWLLFHADEHAKAGDHSGAIRISVDDERTSEIDLVVRVRSIRLPRPNIAFGLYHHMNLFSEEFIGEDLQRQYYRDMTEHGMTTCAIEPTDWGPTVDEGRIQFDAWPVGRMMGMMMEAGLTHEDVGVMMIGGPIKMVADKRAAAADLLEERRKHGWPELLLYMRDEPPLSMFDQLEPWLTEWKRIPDIRNVAAMNSVAAYRIGYLHDVWVILNDQVTRELVKEARRLGSDVWTYAIDLRFTNPLANRYFAGLYTWGLGLGGNHPWAYRSFIRPTKDGPVPSVGWEGRREGVDDYRYLQLLETWLAAAPSENPTAREARAWLSALRGRIGWNFYHGSSLGDPRLTDKLNPAPHIGVEEYDAIREKVAEYVRRLESVVKKPVPAPVHRIPKPIVGKYEPARFLDKSVAECVEGLSSSDVADRRSAASALALRGRQAGTALPRLIELLDDEDVRFVALRAIEAIGPEAEPAVPALAGQLAHSDPFVRLAATMALTAIGPAGVESLEKSLEDESWYVSCQASKRLGELKAAAAPMVPALARQLARRNQDRAYYAARALREIGPAAAEATDALIKALETSPHMATASLAARTLGDIGDPAEKAVPALLRAAAKEDESVRAAARIALFRIRGVEEDLNALLNMMPDAPSGLRKDIARDLKSLGSRIAPVKEQIRRLLQSEQEEDVRRELRQALDNVQ